MAKVYRFDGISYEPDELRVVRADGEAVRLKQKQCKLLNLFVSAINHRFTHDEIMDKVWGEDASVDLSKLSGLVRELRVALFAATDSSPTRIPRIESVGKGYRLVVRSMEEGDTGDINRPEVDLPSFNYRTILDFPTQFESITAVVGDHHDNPPRKFEDIAICSPGVDLEHLTIEAHYETKSDKYFAEYNEDKLREIYSERTLLIVASPYVNFAARLINKHSIFRFNLEPEAELFMSRFQQLKQITSKAHVHTFYKMAQAPMEINVDAEEYREKIPDRSRREGIANEVRSLFADLDENIESITDKFIRNSFIDLTANKIFTNNADNGIAFGTVSLARNPFSQDSKYVCIYVAGYNAIATAKCLRLLSNPQDHFRHHPFGGIIQVTVNNPLEENVDEVDWVWKTEGYNPLTVIQNLKKALDPQSTNSRNKVMRLMTTEQIKDCFDFLCSLLPKETVDEALSNLETKSARDQI